MAPKLYMTEPSPVSRAVLMTEAVLGIELEHHHLDLFKSEHRTPEYSKMNPEQTVPTLVDDNYILWDSHAIIPYLVGKYGNNASLYPKDLKIRATVDQRLHFDNGTLFNIMFRTVRPILLDGVTEIRQDQIDTANEAYKILNILLDGNEWIAGEHLTIADISIAASVSTLDVLFPLDSTKYPNLMKWFEHIQELPFYKANEAGLSKFRNIITSKLSTP